MNYNVIARYLEIAPKEQPVADATVAPAPAPSKAKQKRVHDKTISYTARHRGQWFKPDFTFNEIHLARKTDGYAFRAVQKKVNRVLVAGWSFTANRPEPKEYIERRLAEIEWASQQPWGLLMEQIFTGMFSISNHVLIKKRSAELSSGQTRMHFGKEVEPVAGYFPVDFDTLQIRTRRNGEIKKWRQVDPLSGDMKEYSPDEVVFFRTNQDPGYSLGFPELFPALDDIALLRRIEENVEDLIEANLFPVFHYKIGSDTFPEVMGPDGLKETDVIRSTLEYMPAGGVYISDHRHNIEAIGSEGRALRIEAYISHFKNRALSSLGTSAIDMGEGAGANRSTASTLSKGMLLDVEAMTLIVKRYFEFYIINELLLEGGFNPFNPEDRVEIRFGVIDKEERRADENQQIQMFTNNLRTMDEVRVSLGDKPMTDEMLERTNYKLFSEPADLLKNMTPGGASAEALAKTPVSNLTPEGVKKEERMAKEKEAAAQQAKAATGPMGRPATKQDGTSANRARPANQNGRRASAKTTRDFLLTDGAQDYSVTCDSSVDAVIIDKWTRQVYERWDSLKEYGITLDTVIYNLLPSLENQ